MSREDQEAQEDELLALTSIYSEEEFKRKNAGSGGEIHLCLELPSNFVISIKSNSATNSFAENFENTVSFLPPIVLNFELPPDYPSTAPPDFTLSCKWLSPAQLTLLCQHLDDLWEENRGCVVLFPWIQFLKEETLDYLNIKSPYEIEVSSNGLQNWMQPPEKTPADGVLLERGSFDKRAIQDVQSVSALVKYILVFSEAQEKKVFDSKPFLCDICFVEKLGSECTHFKDCQHVYCNSCLKDYFEVQINDGQVHALNCPEPKCKSTATPAQVKYLVGEQLFGRYDRLLLQSSLDLMADVVYCPRLSCQTPVMQEPEGTMGICSACKFAFCILCNMTFHGISPCKIPDDKFLELSEEYLAANEERRREMDKRYGDVLKAVEGLRNMEWIGKYSKACPGCKAPTEKIDGCNRMTCTRCRQNFCWLCLKILPQDNPYKHFDSPSECFNRLHEKEEN
ncbi:E3 ubiquitin-protein ligase RNF14-like [Phyllobates terribilis]|uniref:E3 ubiquitin-protein ligase RNF14-like n=1 Tax=Phyllobates terribilis TaxID=111132 RepID=UPI003CCA9985